MWRRDEKIPGLTFAETDEIVMAMELAVREVPGWQRILQAQLDRTQNPDRKARFAFVMPALSADPRHSSPFFNFRNRAMRPSGQKTAKAAMIRATSQNDHDALPQWQPRL